MNRFQPTKQTNWQTKAIPKLNTNTLSDLLKASYSKTGKAQQIGEQNGYKLDRELSNRKQRVFIDKKNNPVVAFTGTRTMGDVITDGMLAVGLGGFTNRFHDSKKLVNQVKKKYNRPVTTIGHSLGGTLSEHAGGDKIITVNKGVGLFGIGKKIGNNQTDIRTGSDPVSFLGTTQSGGKKITIKNTKYMDPLYAHNLDHVKKLNKIL